MKLYLLILSTAILISCQHIETGDTLNKKTIKHIKSLGLLDDNEKIVRYYSNYTKRKAGNFFTNKRLSHYWLGADDPSENDTSFAYYKDIISIYTVSVVPDTFAPYMKITRTDSSEFKVFIEGTGKEVKSFFEEAIDLWQKNKN